uniref:C-type lectin domain-containing protein n=1 Tax=Ciona savignyi TaxID=51511 RepID=H2YCR8_CIOSA
MLVLKFTAVFLFWVCVNAQPNGPVQGQMYLTCSANGEPIQRGYPGKRGPHGLDGRKGDPGLRGSKGQQGAKGQRAPPPNLRPLENSLRTMQTRFDNEIAKIKRSQQRNWFSPGNGYVYISSQSHQGNYASAKRNCASIGARIATVAPRSVSVMRLLMDGLNNVWVGLTDIRREGRWIWEGGLRLKTAESHWARGEPTNSKGIEDCVVALADGLWNDVPCNLIFTPLCEKSIFDVAI